METWLGLAALTFALTLLAWGGWPRGAARPQRAEPAAPLRSGPVLGALLIEYALNAVGLVPHMVFLVDFIARGLGQGLEIGSVYWVVFGLGASVGPLSAGMLADRIGFRIALRAAFVIQAVAIAALAVSSHAVSLVVSSFIVGAFAPGIVPLVLGRLHELIADVKGRTAAWGFATTAFSVGQAGAAYGFSYLFAHSAGGYALLFALGAGALCVALAIDVVAGLAFSNLKPSTVRRS